MSYTLCLLKIKYFSHFNYSLSETLVETLFPTNFLDCLWVKPAIGALKPRLKLRQSKFRSKHELNIYLYFFFFLVKDQRMRRKKD